MTSTMSDKTNTSEVILRVLALFGLFLLGTVPLPVFCHFMPYHNLTIGMAAINILGTIMVTHIETPDYDEHGHRIITGNEIGWKMQVFGWGSVVGLLGSVILFGFILK
jgi:hypothetical protein